jgi:RNA recognition motif-containing protein
VFIIGESKSVYVGNLPSSVTEADLESEFKKFGRLIPDGVAIRSRKVRCQLNLDSPFSVTLTNFI